MVNRLARLVPFTGVLFALLVLAGMATAQPPPDVHASGDKVLAFSKLHASSQRTADGLIIMGCVFFVLFAGALRGYLRKSPRAEAASTVALVGAGMMTVGAAVYIGLDFASNAAPNELAPAAAQALNVLALQLVFPLTAGAIIFGLSIGAAILRSGLLPAWLGWVAVVIGIVPLWILQVLLLCLWAIAVSIILYRRTPATDPPQDVVVA